MPRPLRIWAEGFPFHILNRGNNKQTVFYEQKDYQSFLGLLKESKERFDLRIFSYCLMPNHFHLVVLSDPSLSKAIQWLLTSYSVRHHLIHGGTGHLWQGRFKGFLIQEDRYLLGVLRYVEGNPVRSGLVKSALDWPWSSHRERVERGRGLIDSKLQILDALPIELPADWTDFVDKPLNEKELEKIRLSLNRQAPLGDPYWQNQIAERFQLQSTLKARGRPKGNGV